MGKGPRPKQPALSKAAQIRRLVRSIPPGRVTTYGDLAEAVDCGPRQAAQALKTASPGDRLPWHRVIAAGGRIALPAERGLEQRLRLEAEGVPFRGAKVAIRACHWRPKTPL